MTPEKQRIAIAEFCGEWPPKRATSIKEIEAALDDKRNLVVNLLPSGEVAAFPDYLNSVDAMLTAVEKLTPKQKKVFCNLMNCGSMSGWETVWQEELFDILTRPASSWAKCFLRAVGKWEGE